ncbi:MAG: hypothetical protein HYX26_08080 [Acidobacteriales bacterium]|nr:hypothetical protein [Terriglobales bacterium]
MTRDRPRPVVRFRDARRETMGLIVYVTFILAIAAAFGLRTHVGSVGLHASTLHAWHEQNASSLLAWAGFFFVAGVVFPLIMFMGIKRYSASDLLLRFPEPKKWASYGVITGLLTLSAFITPAYFQVPLWGHALTILLFSMGTFLPVMVLFQCLLAPRFEALTGSWASGAILAGLAYGLYHSGEFFYAWDSPQHIAASLAWILQFAFFGVLKAVTTLRTGNAWLHILNTHLPHLAEAPEVVRIFAAR